ncbi:VrrA/YqfQ family protein [Peribacillus glennii]|nr:VrrA/YqfQ family protein [Peribacillus glennii]
MPPGRKNVQGWGTGRRQSFTGSKKGKIRKGIGTGQNRPLLANGNPAETKAIQRQSNGGLISKLLGKGNQKNPSQASLFKSPSGSATSGGDILQAIKDPATLTTMLANTQKVLSAAEQIGAMVQQYGPLIKNLPEMWKIYRSMSETQASDEPDEEIQIQERKRPDKPKRKKTKVKESYRQRLQITDEQKDKKKRKKKNSSSPKLYI